MPAEPRFLIIDLHKSKAVPATTDEMQALLWREESTGEAYFEQKKNTQENQMDFGQALTALKAGDKIAREGWNGKGMWLCLIPAGNAMFKGFHMQDCIGIKTASCDMQPGWLASQNDMLSEDWVIVE